MPFCYPPPTTPSPWIDTQSPPQPMPETQTQPLRPSVILSNCPSSRNSSDSLHHAQGPAPTSDKKTPQPTMPAPSVSPPTIPVEDATLALSSTRTSPSYHEGLINCFTTTSHVSSRVNTYSRCGLPFHSSRSRRCYSRLLSTFTTSQWNIFQYVWPIRTSKAERISCEGETVV
jgi:hypothetical protein